MDEEVDFLDAKSHTTTIIVRAVSRECRISQQNRENTGLCSWTIRAVCAVGPFARRFFANATNLVQYGENSDALKLYVRVRANFAYDEASRL